MKDSLFSERSEPTRKHFGKTQVGFFKKDLSLKLNSGDNSPRTSLFLQKYLSPHASGGVGPNLGAFISKGNVVKPLLNEQRSLSPTKMFYKTQQNNNQFNNQLPQLMSPSNKRKNYAN